MLWRAFSQVVVFLYLLDEETSYLVIVPMGVGTVIEVRLEAQRAELARPVDAPRDSSFQLV